MSARGAGPRASRHSRSRRSSSSGLMAPRLRRRTVTLRACPHTFANARASQVLGFVRGRKTGSGRLRRGSLGADRRLPRHPLGTTRWAAQYRPARAWVGALPRGAHGVGGDDVRTCWRSGCSRSDPVGGNDARIGSGSGKPSRRSSTRPRIRDLREGAKGGSLGARCGLDSSAAVGFPDESETPQVTFANVGAQGVLFLDGRLAVRRGLPRPPTVRDLSRSSHR
jgi:hypothetical protein